MMKDVFPVVAVFVGLVAVAVGAFLTLQGDQQSSTHAAPPAGSRAAPVENVPDGIDEVVDADEVVMVRNAEEFPNFVLICHDGNAYVGTRQRSADGPQTPVFPDPQRHDQCAHTGDE